MKVSKAKLDIAMAKACLSVDELSIKAKVGQTTIARIGRVDTVPKTVGKIAKALGVDVQDILED